MLLQRLLITIPLHQLITRRLRNLSLHAPAALHHLEPVQHTLRRRRISGGVEGYESLALALDAALDVDVEGREVHEFAELCEARFLGEDLRVVSEALGVDAPEVDGAGGELGVLHFRVREL